MVEFDLEKDGKERYDESQFVAWIVNVATQTSNFPANKLRYSSNVWILCWQQLH